MAHAPQPAANDLSPAPGPDVGAVEQWYRRISGAVDATYIVTTATAFRYLERWAAAEDIPTTRLLSDGSTTAAAGIGALQALELVVRTRQIAAPVLVAVADRSPGDNADLSAAIDRFRATGANTAVVCSAASIDSANCDADSSADIPSSRHPVLLCLQPGTLQSLPAFLAASVNQPSPDLSQWLAWVAPHHNIDIIHASGAIPQVPPSPAPALPLSNPPLRRRAYARVGLMGNPSDGFFGKTIALTIANFWAEATIAPSSVMRIVPHPLHDPTSFRSLKDLHRTSTKDGYSGGIRLLQAACKRFVDMCDQFGIAVSARPFTLTYDTNIPRQVGLAGSSAIITAVFRCLMAFHNVDPTAVPVEVLPSIILSVETEELGIAGGLQDRVAQVYEGLVFMDFDRHLLETRKYGEYTRLPMEWAPPLWLAYCPDPSDSGRIHSTVKERWRTGDPEVVVGMVALASLAEEACATLEARDWGAFAALMDRNFDLRRRMFGDACLGAANLEMIAIARAHGASAKFPGSGGAVVGICPKGPPQCAAVREALEAAGYVVVPVVPHGPDP